LSFSCVLESPTLSPNARFQDLKRYAIHIVTLFAGVVFLLSLFMAGGVLLQSWREYQGFRIREVQMAAEVASSKAELERRRTYLKAMMEDPAFLDRVVRERLGYARENEIIFRFEPETPAPSEN
jgi:cell division protein DivIC